MPPNRVHKQPHVISFPLRRVPQRLVACSVCLCVQDGGAWIETEEAIRRLRTFERDHVVRLAGGICERCETKLRLRRVSGSEDLAA